MDGISYAICAGFVTANLVCVEPSYMLVETVMSDAPTVHLVETFDDPAKCFDQAISRKPQYNGFLSCVGADEIAEQRIAITIAREIDLAD